MSISRPYRKLPTAPLPDGADLFRYDDIAKLPIGLDEPAERVMTDLRQVRVVTVSSDATLDEAQQVMILAGVRLLIVLDSRQRIVGLVTSRDVIGEKPIHYASVNRVTRNDIRVADIMTGKARIEVLRLEEVERASVGDIVETLREARRQHAVVVEELRVTGELLLRGLFSVTQIGRRLGIEIEPSGQVQSFSELEAILSPGSSIAAS
ncbi:MAG TPA: CBS domain-containing protein [Gammaproteobacteria bacterium]